LYICEKKSVGAALADVLPGTKKREENFIRRGEDIVAWASGHLLELCEPEDYDPAYKKWSRGTLLYVPDKWRLKEKERTKALLSGLKKLIKGLSSSDTVVNVGDGDREGQTLIDEILEFCGWKGQTKRLRLNDLNPGAIRKALENIRDNAEYRGEYMAGQARTRADWLVGLAVSRFVTVSLRDAGYDAGVISVGRVQTPTLGLVVERDREIREFVPYPYFDLRAVLEIEGGGRISGRLAANDSHLPYIDAENRITDRGWVEGLAARLDGAGGLVSKTGERVRKISPPLPFSLSKLQMAASKKFDITDALVHAQKLYELGYITYPRAGCEYIPEGHFPEAPKVMDAIRAGCPGLSDMLGGVDLNKKSAAWNTSKISEHHAIIPTVKAVRDGTVSETERKIYELICARYALQFMAEYEYEERAVEFESNGELFRASGRTVINIGWQGWDKQDAQNGGDENGAEILPSVKEGERGKIQASWVEKTTSPPKPYTYHSLLYAMNNIHLFVKDQEIRAKLKEVQGIGTEATQEGILSILFKRGYLEKRKKQVLSTSLGKLLIRILSGGKTSVLVSPDMTALWEKTMTDIEKGNAALDSFTGEVADMVRGMISDGLAIPSDISEAPGIARQLRCLTDGCEGFLRRIEKPGKVSFFSCPLCHATFRNAGGEPVPGKPFSGEILEAPCPLGCGKQARRFEGMYGYFWKCFCSPGVVFKDSGGKPAAPEKRPEVNCPVPGCAGKAIRFQRKDVGYFWKCGKCGGFFDDVSGVPAVRANKKLRKEKRG
jgi:DNA topoisomerase-3